jgi:hypothetical protein
MVFRDNSQAFLRHYVRHGNDVRRTVLRPWVQVKWIGLLQILTFAVPVCSYAPHCQSPQSWSHYPPPLGSPYPVPDRGLPIFLPPFTPVLPQPASFGIGQLAHFFHALSSHPFLSFPAGRIPPRLYSRICFVLLVSNIFKLFCLQ